MHLSKLIKHYCTKSNLKVHLLIKTKTLRSLGISGWNMECNKSMHLCLQICAASLKELGDKDADLNIFENESIKPKENVSKYCIVVDKFVSYKGTSQQF